MATGRGSCFATDMITVEGRKIGYMYREEPDSKQKTKLPSACALWVELGG